MTAHDSLVRWLVDTRALWADGLDGAEALRALARLEPPERDAVRKYVHLRDAKMSLASRLLKRVAIAQLCGVSWSAATATPGAFRKPCFRPQQAGIPSLSFNVSHQAGLVAMVAQRDTTRQLGVDVVCVNERDDYRHVDAEGFDAWVGIYEEVFSAQEMRDIQFDLVTLLLPDGTELGRAELASIVHCNRRNVQLSVELTSGQRKTISSNILIDAKLRRFYAYWALKEAYIKMTGEALMAKWLRDLEFRNVRAPDPAHQWGERVTDIEIWLHGKQVTDVQIELWAFEDRYMLATAVGPESSTDPALPGDLPDFVELDIMKTVDTSNIDFS